MEERNILNQQQLSFSTFIKISILLCLANLAIIGRLHMYDESTITAQHFYNSHIKMAGGNPNPTISTAKFTKDTNVTSLFTQIQLQSSYLLPLALCASAFFVILVFAQSILDQLHKNLMMALSGNLICFLLLWLLPGIFIVYRLTYLIQALLIFPMLITSTLGLARIIPDQINNYKVYYICLMFFLPYLGIPIIYWLFDGYPYNISPTDILVSALNKVLLFGIFICCVSFYFLRQNKDEINNSIAKIPENYTLQLLELQPKQSMQISQQIIHNHSKISQIKQTNKKSKNLARQKLNGMMICWGIIMAVASQLTNLKKYLLANNQLKDELINGQSTKSSVLQFKTTMYTIIISLILIGLIRDRRVKILQVTILSTTIGYTSLIVLFVAVNKLLTLDLQLINTCIMVSRIFMMVFVIPIVMFIGQQGTAVVQGISVLFLFSWGTQMILRLILPIFDDSVKLFVLTLIALLGCYWVARTGKQFQDDDRYNQIKQQGEADKQQHSLMAIPNATEKIPNQTGAQIQKSNKMIISQKFNQQQQKPLSVQVQSGNQQ